MAVYSAAFGCYYPSSVSHQCVTTYMRWVLSKVHCFLHQQQDGSFSLCNTPWWDGLKDCPSFSAQSLMIKAFCSQTLHLVRGFCGSDDVPSCSSRMKWVAVILQPGLLPIPATRRTELLRRCTYSCCCQSEGLLSCESQE